jgi:hypothetical protein
MSKVYVVQEPVRVEAGERVTIFDLSPTLEFGQPEILITHNQSAINTVPMVRQLNDKLKDFSDNDYLVPTGDPIMICLAAMAAARANGGRVKLLRWEKRQRKYYCIPVDMSGREL